ncbi:MAG: hypothetical protein H6714_00120 [Myxococcales bacterium]|nr:hypothetical protein [Myxococcales bacterium]
MVESDSDQLPAEEARDRLLTGEPLVRSAPLYVHNLSDHEIVVLSVMGPAVTLTNLNIPENVAPYAHPFEQAIPLYPQGIGLADYDWGRAYTEASNDVWIDVGGPWRQQSKEFTLKFIARSSGAQAMAYLNWSRAKVSDLTGSSSEADMWP